jgi:hypothetical protein
MNADRTKAAERLRDELDYNPETGELSWKSEAPESTRKVYEKCRDGYLRLSLTIDGISHRFMAHRIAWFMAHGSHPNGEIDHINGDRSDNRLCNMRDVSRSENCRNAAKRKDNKSGVSGVYWDKTQSFWRAMVRHGGKRHYVGVFADIEEAKRCVDLFRAERGFTERHGSS